MVWKTELKNSQASADLSSPEVTTENPFEAALAESCTDIEAFKECAIGVDDNYTLFIAKKDRSGNIKTINISKDRKNDWLIHLKYHNIFSELLVCNAFGANGLRIGNRVFLLNREQSEIIYRYPVTGDGFDSPFVSNNTMGCQNLMIYKDMRLNCVLVDYEQGRVLIENSFLGSILYPDKFIVEIEIGNLSLYQLFHINTEGIAESIMPEMPEENEILLKPYSPISDVYRTLHNAENYVLTTPEDEDEPTELKPLLSLIADEPDHPSITPELLYKIYLKENLEEVPEAVQQWVDDNATVIDGMEGYKGLVIKENTLIIKDRVPVWIDDKSLLAVKIFPIENTGLVQINVNRGVYIFDPYKNEILSSDCIDLDFKLRKGLSNVTTKEVLEAAKSQPNNELYKEWLKKHSEIYKINENEAFRVLKLGGKSYILFSDGTPYMNKHSTQTTFDW